MLKKFQNLVIKTIYHGSENEWKKNFDLNPDMIVYGTGEVKILDYGIFNQKDEPTPVMYNDEEITIKLKAKFLKNIECPTFSITIKDFLGKEMCGTNTNIQKIYTGSCKENEKYSCEFKQKLMLAPGKYTLSISCSKYGIDGDVIPINRNYDALFFEVMSKKPVVGNFALDTKVDFTRIEE